MDNPNHATMTQKEKGIRGRWPEHGHTPPPFPSGSLAYKQWVRQLQKESMAAGQEWRPFFAAAKVRAQFTPPTITRPRDGTTVDTANADYERRARPPHKAGTPEYNKWYNGLMKAHMLYEQSGAEPRITWREWFKRAKEQGHGSSSDVASQSDVDAARAPVADGQQSPHLP